MDAAVISSVNERKQKTFNKKLKVFIIFYYIYYYLITF